MLRGPFLGQSEGLSLGAFCWHRSHGVTAQCCAMGLGIISGAAEEGDGDVPCADHTWVGHGAN
eukprot:2009816-Alexandrium_andersonii.AAC.1